VLPERWQRSSSGTTLVALLALQVVARTSQQKISSDIDDFPLPQLE
jgi:hypothetical protein